MEFSIMEFNAEDWISVPVNKTSLYKTVFRLEDTNYVPLKDFIVKNSWDIFRGEDILRAVYYPESLSISITLKDIAIPSAKLKDIYEILQSYKINEWYIEAEDVVKYNDGYAYPCLKLIIFL